MKLRLFSYILFFYFLLLNFDLTGQVRSVIDFNKDWKFLLGNDSSAIEIKYDDSKWRQLSLPHDWSIESDFVKDAPATNQGGSLPGGIGWYRKTFTLPVSAKDKNVFIEFDGVYKNSEVWINGHYLGKRPNGYVAFSYDLTPFLLPSPQKNVIAVKVDNSQQPDSRWYTGSGIYRNVKLIIKNKLAFGEYQPIVTTHEISDQSATIAITTRMNKNFAGQMPVFIAYTIIDNKGIEVAKQKPYKLSAYDPVNCSITFNGPCICDSNLSGPVVMITSNQSLPSFRNPG